MKINPKLSVVLATFNEAENIQRCLRAVQGIADEIIVVDGESTDDTVKLAQQLGAQVISTSNKPIFHINKQIAIDASHGEWVLQLDADEVVDGEMVDAISTIIDSGSEHSAFWLRRRNYFLGRFLTKGGQYPDPVIRLFKQGKAHLPAEDVHEQMEVDGSIGWLGGHLLHYNAPTFARYIRNANRYTSLTAQTYMDQNLGTDVITSLYYLIIKPKLTFFKLFIRHRAYVDGFPGFAFALFSGLHTTLAYMKYYDLQRAEKKTREI